MKLLFVCSKNQLRSPTAEHIFSQINGIEALSAGTEKDADVPLDEELIEWAEYIFVMEKTHERKVREKFKKQINNQKIICLNIKDDFKYMDSELIKILKSKLEKYL